MKKLITLFLISNVIFFLNLRSQNATFDSLENLLQKNKIKNKNRVILLNKIANKLFRIDKKKLLKYVKEAEEISKKIDFQEGEAESFYILGKYNYFTSNYDKAIEYYKKSIELNKILENKTRISACFNNIGIIFNNKGDYERAIEFYKKSLNIDKEIGDEKGVSMSFNNIGLIYWRHSNYKKALKYYQKSLKIREKLKDKNGISRCLNNIGLIYNSQKNHEKALECFEKSLKMKDKINDKDGYALCLNNIALIYQTQKKYKKALEYYKKSLKINEEINNKKGIAMCFNNIALSYYDKEENEKSMEYHYKSLRIKEKLDDKNGISTSYFNIGVIYCDKNNYKKSLNFILKSLKISKELGHLDEQRKIHRYLANIYSKIKNYKKAFENYKVFKNLNDSIFNEKNVKEMTGLEYKYKHEKEKEIIKIEQEKKNTIYSKEIKHQKTVRNFFIIGMILTIIMVLLIFYSFLEKRKANRILFEQKKKITEMNTELNQTNEELNTTLETIKEQKEKITENNEELNQMNEELNTTLETINEQKEKIEESNYELNATLLTVNKQKEKIEESHKQIRNSINYASRIQNAIMPNLDLFEDNFLDYFIMFKPRDVVSGDFYWAKKINEFFIFVAADCTGHGVPGAFVSMLGISLLNEIVMKEKIIKPNEVLDLLRDEIKNSFKTKGKKIGTKDGMDLAMCVINTKTNELQFSGANNPLYLIRNKELIEFKGDKQPIGAYRKEKKFTNQIIKFKKNDLFYVFSDGYIDQFGGEKGRKFMKKKFKKLILKIQNKNMKEQRQILNEVFENWKGDLKQIDDTLVIGVKI